MSWPVRAGPGFKAHQFEEVLVENGRETRRNRSHGRRRPYPQLRPELLDDPALKVMAARLSLAMGGLDESDAARLLLSLGQGDPRRLEGPAGSPGIHPRAA